MCLSFVLKQIKADPHPGNIMMQRDGRPVLIDWGQCMRLNRPQRRRLIQMVILLRTRCMELILAGLNMSGFAFPPEVTGDTAAMIFFSFDSAISSPFTNDIKKLGAKIRNSPSKLNVPTKAPREVIFFARVMQCLRRGNELLGLDLSAIDRWAPIARRELRTMVYEDGPEKRLPKASIVSEVRSKRDVVFEEEKDEDDTQLWAPSRLLLMMDTTQFLHVQDGVVWAQGHPEEMDALFRLSVIGAQSLGAGFLSRMATFVSRNEKLVSFGLKHPWLTALCGFLFLILVQKCMGMFLDQMLELSIWKDVLSRFERDL
jgi:predicted unusual protein kinase regulating ubiquinone biosynthesis (AarF/ABC1/UbiB family)